MTELDKIYYINAGKKGTFASSGHVKSTPGDVDAIFNYLSETDIDQLLVYFHGGLVSERNGMTAAGVMKDHFADPSSKKHVVSFVWETGPGETVLQNLSELLGEDKFAEIVKFAIKLAAKRLGLQDTKGGGEYLNDTTILEEKQKTAPFEDLDKAIGAKGGSGGLADIEEEVLLAELENESSMLIQSEASEELMNAKEDDPTTKGGLLGVIKIVAQIAFAVLKRYIKKTHHDFYPTVIEEAFKKVYLDKLGEWGWGEMKEKAGELFYSNAGLSGDQLHTGTYFLHKLQQHIEARTLAGKTFRTELIGHSAGSIAICHLLEQSEAQFPGLRYNNVFFLAPACRTDFFLEKGKPALEKGIFNRFTLFTMREENEKKDHCIPYLYTHSLLYMISGLFENEEDAKIMGLEEQFKATDRYSGFPELQELHAFLDGKTVVLSDDITNPDERKRSGALKHGAFDNDEYTLTSILKTI